MISLREVIQAANNTPGVDSIAFNIPACGGVCTIQPLTPLPDFSGGSTTIGGYTQPGAYPASASQPATLLVELDGSLVTEFGGDRPAERNLLSANDGCGVTIQYGGANDNIVSGNYIGTDVTGSLRLGNLDEGVSIWGGQDTTIQNNLISANGDYGIYMSAHDHNLTGNAVYGNYIGTDATGTLDLGNLDDGIYIFANLPLVAQNNPIGGLQPGEGNVISGNGQNGIFLKGSGTSANPILGNVIGGDPGSSLEIFASPTSSGQGRHYLGATSADGSGQFSLSLASLPAPYLTATATHLTDGTSEFSAPFRVGIEMKIYLPLVRQ